MNPRPRLSVIIPTHNGAETLAACLQSLQSSSRLPQEIVVVDDASSDGSAGIAARLGCSVVRLEENVGAARAKNRGAAAATGDILFFTDDDVVVAQETLARLVQGFGDPQVAGVVGVLGDELPFNNFASQFKNLWMRFSYTRLPRERIGVFYTSVAAMRREVFQALGGFDEHYAGASVAEDTEFGQRAWAAGNLLVLAPDVSVMHCKHYTLPQVLTTDFWRARALMLIRLRKWGQPFFTSVPLFYQLAVPVVALLVLSLLVALVFSSLPAFRVGLVLLVLFYVLNAPWLGYLGRVRGVGFAVLAALFQPFDVLAVGAGMSAGLLDWVRGVRY